MPLLERDEDVRIYFETHGEAGPWVTLVNGYTRPLTDFRAMVRYLTERGRRVLMFDSRGVGKTDYEAGFSMDDIAEDVLALWKHLEISKSHLLGISYGGAIAAMLAAKRPPELDKLMLVSTPRDAQFIRGELDGPPRDPRRFTFQFTRYFSPAFLKSNQILVQGFLRQLARTFQEPESALGARAQRESMQEMDLVPLLSAIKAPTLIIQGDQDGVVPVESGKQLANGISGATLDVVEGAGHLLLVEAPLRLYETIDRFFK